MLNPYISTGRRGISVCTLNVRFQGCLILNQPYRQTGARAWTGVSRDPLLRVSAHQVTLQKHSKNMHSFIQEKELYKHLKELHSEEAHFEPEAKPFGCIKPF